MCKVLSAPPFTFCGHRNATKEFIHTSKLSLAVSFFHYQETRMTTMTTSGSSCRYAGKDGPLHSQSALWTMPAPLYRCIDNAGAESQPWILFPSCIYVCTNRKNMRHLLGISSPAHHVEVASKVRYDTAHMNEPTDRQRTCPFSRVQRKSDLQLQLQMDVDLQDRVFVLLKRFEIAQVCPTLHLGSVASNHFFSDARQIW